MHLFRELLLSLLVSCPKNISDHELEASSGLVERVSEASNRGRSASRCSMANTSMTGLRRFNGLLWPYSMHVHAYMDASM